MAFYVHHVPGTTWAGPSSAAKQQNALLHWDKESSIILHNKTAWVPVSKGYQYQGWVFLLQEPSSIQQVFLVMLGFSSSSPSACISKGGAAEPSCCQANKPLPHTYT
eukprot:2032378-Ditylum_brightwellii.AAC.1